MPTPRTAYITTSIPYINGAPHVGHALEFVQADAFARYRRQLGDRVRLQTGTDDNSLKNVLAAEREGIAPSALVERNAAAFRALLDSLNVGYDGFLRTSTDPAHRRGVHALWAACDRAGAIYRKHYRGLYCVGCEAFLSADELTSDGLCPEHLAQPETVEEDNYFFRLSRYAAALRDRIATGALHIVPESRRNEVLAFIDAGLHDFSISRSQARARGWGIPVPGDASQVIYVWFDALGNYITALGYPDDGPQTPYHIFWSGVDRSLHVIGKGILRFHAVYWPAMLLAAGLPLPRSIFVHGYLTVDGRKIGKSLGNAGDPQDLIARHGADALRWYLLRDALPVADSDFTEARLVARYNADLANDLGNLLNRASAMLHRYRDGVVPAAGDGIHHGGNLPAIAAALPARLADAMAGYDPRAALAHIWELVVAGNRLVDDAAPWALHRAERAGDAAAASRLDGVLYAVLEALRLTAIHLASFLPHPAAEIHSRLGQDPASAVPYAEQVRWGGLPPGAQLAPPTPLFPRLTAS